MLVWGCRVVIGGGGLAFDVASSPCRSYVGGGLSEPHGQDRAEEFEPREAGRGQVQHETDGSVDAFDSQFCAIEVTPPVGHGRAEVWSRSREQGDSKEAHRGFDVPRREEISLPRHSKEARQGSTWLPGQPGRGWHPDRTKTAQKRLHRGLDGPRREEIFSSASPR